MLALQAGVALLFVPCVHALTFSDSDLETMLDFRQKGTANPYDLEINLGCVTNFYGIPVGQTISVTNYTAAQLANAMAATTFENVEFSVCAGDYTEDTGASTNYPRGIMWITYPRSSFNTQSVPFARTASSLLISAAAEVNQLGDEAAFYSGINSPDPLANTSTAVAIPPGNAASCEKYLGPGNNSKLNGKFPQNIGQFAPNPFSTAIRSDFYVDYPTTNPDPLNNNAPSGVVSLIGYFTFNTDGTLTFTRQANTVSFPTATTLTITQSGGVNTISFTSVANATYTLFYTDQAGLTNPRSTWTQAPGTITGDGTMKQFTDTPPPTAGAL